MTGYLLVVAMMVVALVAVWLVFALDHSTESDHPPGDSAIRRRLGEPLPPLEEPTPLAARDATRDAGANDADATNQSKEDA